MNDRYCCQEGLNNKAAENLFIPEVFYICIIMLTLNAKRFMTINRPVQDEVGRFCGYER